tara:strand:- start:3396 stop:3719 length:324 start_codon:yes stop_codon:yes gene_type:complete
MLIYKTTCFFGTKINKNNIISYVTKTDWNSFINFNIKDKIPSFTTSKHIGYWNGEKELTYSLSVYHSKDDNNVIKNLKSISKKYIDIFDQDEIIINTVKTENIYIIN